MITCRANHKAWSAEIAFLNNSGRERCQGAASLQPPLPCGVHRFHCNHRLSTCHALSTSTAAALSRLASWPASALCTARDAAHSTVTQHRAKLPTLNSRGCNEVKADSHATPAAAAVVTEQGHLDPCPRATSYCTHCTCAIWCCTDQPIAAAHTQAFTI
jgi:hypothetical protein